MGHNKGMNDSVHSVGSLDMNEITFGQLNPPIPDPPNENSTHELNLSRWAIDLYGIKYK